MTAASATKRICLGQRSCNSAIHLLRSSSNRSSLWIAALVFAVLDIRITTGFQLPSQWGTKNAVKSCGARSLSLVHNEKVTAGRTMLSKLDMVRNIDLPEAVVFYGLESIMTRGKDGSTKLRSGVFRLLNDCREVGTAALLLTEVIDEEEIVQRMLAEAWETSTDDAGSKMRECLVKDEVISFRCLNSEFSVPDDGNSDPHDVSIEDEYDSSIAFYNVQANGRSPSPAFLLDSLCSVHIDPRGFGGSSGFGRGQWIDPRRSPLPARSVIFIAGDWSLEGDDKSTVHERCAAARAAGCRIVYIEQLPDEAQHNISVEDDTQTMALCDAVVSTLGSDNPRDLQPITLDAVSTPGDYWLNPPSPRDDVGNAVSVDDIVEWFRSEREAEYILGDDGCVINTDDREGDEMSEEEMNKILADLDSL